jgi:hypothetical protein
MIIVYVLGQLRGRAGWIVRCDDHEEIRVPSFATALEQGRQLAQDLANRSGAPTTLRIWARKATPVDETVTPSHAPSLLPRRQEAQ